MPEATKVFISYSHDSEQHKERVLELSERLRADGVESEIDQYEEAPPEGWPRWMNERLGWADYVLVVCTENYAQRFLGGGVRGRGQGAKWEGAIITQALHDADALNTKYVPIVMMRDDARFVPNVLAGATRYTLGDEGGYDSLYRRLTGQPRVRKRAVGAVREMPAMSRKTVAAWANVDPAKPAPERAREPQAAAASLLEKDALLALIDGIDALNQRDTLEDVLLDLLDISGRLIGASAGSVILHDPRRDDLYFAAATGPKRDELAKVRVPVAGSKAGDVYLSGRTLVESTVVGHYNAVDHQTEFETKSMICIPLAHRDKRYGVMQMLNKKGGKEPFDARDVELLVRFGVQASIALHKARLLEQMIGSSGMYAESDERRDLLKFLTEPGRGALRERLTVLAVDMRHFTKLCDEIGDPVRIQELLSTYITMLSDIVLEHRGIVHKIAGDGLWALFRGAGGAVHATRASFAMLAAFDALAQRWRKELGRALADIDLGIGLATSDDMILGTVGNERFRDFTIIGSAVNLAAPLVKAARDGRRILCDAATWNEARREPGLQADGPTAFRPKASIEKNAPSYDVYCLRR